MKGIGVWIGMAALGATAAGVYYSAHSRAMRAIPVARFAAVQNVQWIEPAAGSSAPVPETPVAPATDSDPNSINLLPQTSSAAPSAPAPAAPTPDSLFQPVSLDQAPP